MFSHIPHTHKKFPLLENTPDLGASHWSSMNPSWKQCQILNKVQNILLLKVKVTKSHLTLWDPMDYTSHGIPQVRILGWVAVPFRLPERSVNWAGHTCRLWEAECDGEPTSQSNTLSPSMPSWTNTGSGQPPTWLRSNSEPQIPLWTLGDPASCSDNCSFTAAAGFSDVSCGPWTQKGWGCQLGELWFEATWNLEMSKCFMKVLLSRLRRGVDSLGKTLMLGKEKWVAEDEVVGWHHWCNDMSVSELWEVVKDREAWCAAAHGVAKSQTWLSDWTTTPFTQNTVYFAQAWSLPCGTCLSIHGLAVASPSSKSPPSLQPHRMVDPPFPPPCLHIRSCCLFVWTFSLSITWHGFLRLSLGVNEPCLLIHPCILP